MIKQLEEVIGNLKSIFHKSNGIVITIKTTSKELSKFNKALAENILSEGTLIGATKEDLDQIIFTSYSFQGVLINFEVIN